MSAKRSALGRGLGALIPGREERHSAPAAAPAGASNTAPSTGTPAGEATAVPRDVEAPPGPLHIAVDRIRPNPDQPRRVFDPSHLKELSESIARHGVLQPVVVRYAGDGDYELIVGERRWRASKAAGVATIPAVVADIAPQDRLEIAIVENVQRHDLNPIELAHAYKALAASGATQEQIGARVGLDRSSVANHLRLLELSNEMQEDVESGRFSMGHAKALLSVSSPERQRLLRDRIVRDHLSVRAAERLAREYAAPGAAKPARKAKDKTDVAADSPQLLANREFEPLAEQLRVRLQTQVRITGDLERGRIEVDFFSAEDLDRLTEMLLGGEIQ
jgi:ParB family chromosome partitioning protein